MTVIDHPAPSFSAEDASRLLRDVFGVEGVLSALPSERDQNFRVQDGEGRQFIFKIANASEPLAAVEFQIALLRHIEIGDPSLPVPRVMRPRDGRDFGVAAGRAGERHALRLVTCLDHGGLA